MPMSTPCPCLLRWIEAVEGWNSHVNKVNELAYTSSFGEYNPGGGKEQVAKYAKYTEGHRLKAGKMGVGGAP